MQSGLEFYFGGQPRGRPNSEYSRCHQILLNTIKYHQTLSDTIRYYQILSDTKFRLIDRPILLGGPDEVTSDVSAAMFVRHFSKARFEGTVRRQKLTHDSAQLNALKTMPCRVHLALTERQSVTINRGCEKYRVASRIQCIHIFIYRANVHCPRSSPSCRNSMVVKHQSREQYDGIFFRLHCVI